MAAIACSAVSAQQVTDFRRPGDVIRVEIKFEGADAEKITQVSLYLAKPDGTVPKDQTGFSTGFGGQSFGATGHRTFQADVKIPENVVTGEYVLYVNAQGGIGSTQYATGKDFQLSPFHIRNDGTFTPPKITVTERR
jgi:hypothetical protein